MKRLLTILITILCLTFPAFAEDFDDIYIVNDSESIEDYFFARTGNTWQLYKEDGTLFLDHAWSDEDFHGGFSKPFDGFNGRAAAPIRLGAQQSATYGMIDPDGNLILEPIYDFVSFLSCGRAEVRKGDMYGYADERGNIVIDFLFDEADIFRDNSAIIRLNRKFGLIDLDGNFLIEPVYDWLYEFDGNLQAEYGDLVGSFDRTGNPLVPIEIPAAETTSDENSDAFWTDDPDTLYPIFSDSITSGPDMPVYFDEIVEIEEFFLGRQGDNWQLYNSDGTLFLDHTWTTSDFAGGFWSLPFEGFKGAKTAVVQFGDALQPMYGCIDRKGNVIVQPKYDTLDPFSCDIAMYTLDGKIGFVNAAGNELVPPLFDDALPFSENLAAVRLDGKWGYIGTDGHYVIPAQYYFASSFQNGLATICIGGRYGVIDPDGNDIVPPSCRYIFNYPDGLRIFQDTDGLYGILNIDGTIALESVYNVINRSEGGIYIASLSGEEYFFTVEGDQLVHLDRLDAILY